MDLEEMVEYVDEGELTPRFIKTVVAIMVTVLVVVGVITYYVTFVLLGF